MLSSRGLIVLILLAASAGSYYYFRAPSPPDETSNADEAPIRLVAARDAGQGDSAPRADEAVDPAHSRQDTPGAEPLPAGTDIPVPGEQARGEAAEKLRKGREHLAAGKLLDARKLLSEALASGALAAEDRQSCRSELEKLAEKTILSGRIYPGDRLVRDYTIQGGDMLTKIVDREKLMMPYQALQRINGISNPTSIRPGQKIKLLQGPFNAIITKHTYTLDLYLQDVFVKSFKIGLGRDNSTPQGAWKVIDRTEKSAWTAPTGGVVYPGQKDYPLGRRGIWIRLQGQDPSNETFGGFGIHGTNEPDSIGKQASDGCVRLADDDIALLYDLLYKGSHVDVRP